jgi:hypothetical protein
MSHTASALAADRRAVLAVAPLADEAAIAGMAFEGRNPGEVRLEGGA